MPTEQATIDLRLYAALAPRIAPDAGGYPIKPGMTVEELLSQLPLSADEVMLVFVNGVRKDLQTRLNGGERVGIFPPVGGG